ncbi:MAG: PAS domain S-box protein, partial [Spirochaetes bacterium]|nr:PAS domain S-box protein [Spirochaetota bacterium]
NPFWCSAAKQGNENLIVNINNALANLKASGEYGKIYDKWFSAYKESNLNYTRIFKYSVVIIVIILIILFVVIFWNRSLQNQVLLRTNELEERESLLYGIFDNMPSGSAVYQVVNNGESGSDYIVKFFNKKSLEIEKKSMDQVRGKSLKDLRPEIDNYGLIQLLKKVWQTGNPEFFPAKVYVDENYSNYYENYIFKLPSGDVVTIYDDVTEKETALGKIKESEEKYRKMFENAREGILIGMPDGRIINANSEACRLLGMNEEEIIKEGRKGLIDETDPDFKRAFSIWKSSGYCTGEIKFKRKDGTFFIAQLTASDFRNSMGDKMVIIIFSDISEMKKTEDKLRETADELRQMNGFMVDRELKMVELKEEINELLKAAGKPEKY